jgi:hypothetical protein
MIRAVSFAQSSLGQSHFETKFDSQQPQSSRRICGADTVPVWTHSVSDTGQELYIVSLCIFIVARGPSFLCLSKVSSFAHGTCIVQGLAARFEEGLWGAVGP